MTMENAPASVSPVPGASAPNGRIAASLATAPPSLVWRRAAFLLAGAAQLITISALVSADPIPATWASLLLAIAPALVTAVAYFGPARVNTWAAVAGLAVLVAGIAGTITHTGLFFLPALAALAVATVTLWREQS
ncbi:MAG TPA: hypothetical protein VMI33_13275 [Streptosporangiaceae bacterium]|nr:hypothetical protein [Streptosporangiaceae bacterium]